MLRALLPPSVWRCIVKTVSSGTGSATYLVTEDGDQFVTEAGDHLITES